MTISAMNPIHFQSGKGDFGKTLQKSIAILEQVACFPHGGGVTQRLIALINKSTVSKTLSVFEARAMSENEDSSFFREPKVFSLGRKCSTHWIATVALGPFSTEQ